MTDLADRLLEAVCSDNVVTLSIRAAYRPAGGEGENVMPPSYPAQDGSPYLFEQVWIDDVEHRVVALDQVSSQANRAEEALLGALDDGGLALPLLELRVKTERGEIRLTSLDVPHRYADAYWRECTVGGERFDRSELGRRLRSASEDDVRPLYEREPLSLVYGAWDSQREGRWPRFARLYQSRVVGVDPREGARRGTRMDPLNLVGAMSDSKAARAGGDWEYFPTGEKKKGAKLSEGGLGNIAPTITHGGVSVRSVRRTASISLLALRRLRFGDAPRAAADTARAALLALAFAGDRLAFGGPGMWLRSGCDLVKLKESVGFEHAGGDTDPVEANAAEVLAALEQLRQRAANAGVAMATDVVSVEPTRQLRQAIEYAVTSAVAEAEG